MHRSFARQLLLPGIGLAIAAAAIASQPEPARADPPCGYFSQWKNGWWPFNDFKHGGEQYPGDGWADGQYDAPEIEFHGNFEGGKVRDYHPVCDTGGMEEG